MSSTVKNVSVTTKRNNELPVGCKSFQTFLFGSVINITSHTGTNAFWFQFFFKEFCL